MHTDKSSERTDKHLGFRIKVGNYQHTPGLLLNDTITHSQSNEICTVQCLIYTLLRVTDSLSINIYMHYSTVLSYTDYKSVLSFSEHIVNSKQYYLNTI